MSLDVAFAVIQKDNAILLVNNRDKNGFERWTLPGGKVEERETLSEAVSREIYEETGYYIDQLRIAYLHEAFFFEHAVHVKAFVFQATIDENRSALVDEKHVEDIAKTVVAKKWVPINDLSAYIKNKKILCVLESWLNQPQTAHYFFTKDMTW
jgi:8-oxo-dGTP diphosphatase